MLSPWYGSHRAYKGTHPCFGGAGRLTRGFNSIVCAASFRVPPHPPYLPRWPRATACCPCPCLPKSAPTFQRQPEAARDRSPTLDDRGAATLAAAALLRRSIHTHARARTHTDTQGTHKVRKRNHGIETTLSQQTSKSQVCRPRKDVNTQTFVTSSFLTPLFFDRTRFRKTTKFCCAFGPKSWCPKNWRNMDKQ